jgi:DNA ligase-associated metallophosphoesterase
MNVALNLEGREAELHAPGFLWLPAARLLCVADLHFEKGAFFHQFGSLLPPYDTQSTLTLLEQGLKRFAPQRFIALGDSFHDARSVERLDEEEKYRLNTLISQVPQWVWVTGNHDPSIAAEIQGDRQTVARQDGLVFRHRAALNDEFEISGHYHPKTSIRLRGHRITSPCFVQGGAKLILPALGSFAGGLDIDSKALRAVIPATDRRVFAVHKQQVYAL